ncbi:MAG TPA: hypothetical protein VGJ07_11085 [Rugosimonospora sp.]
MPRTCARRRWARLALSWSRVRNKSNPEGYVRTTMARLHVSRWRRSRREHLVGEVPEQGYADAGLDRVDGGGALWAALAAGSDSHGRPQGVVVWNPATGVWAGLAAPYHLPEDRVDADLAVLQAQSVPGAPIEVFDLTVAGRPA